MNEIAVIFDLDGTLIDNNSYHLLAWQQFYKERNRTLTEEEYKKHFNGKTNTDVLAYVFDGSLSTDEIDRYTNEKEGLYRKIYAPHIKPINGLLTFLQQLQSSGISMAIATSGIKVNIDYMFEHVPIQQYFKKVIYSKHIKKGKPDPEIYFVTAKELNVLPKDCIVFEDSIAGIKSAKAAGMKVIAIDTTHERSELTLADKIIHDYTEVSVSDSKSMVELIFLKNL